MNGYRFNEGYLSLPSDVEDSTMNIFRLKALQATLVISREQLAADLKPDDYFQQQMQLLRKSMKNFLPGEKRPVTLTQSPTIPCYEFSCQFQQQGKSIHQQLLMAVNDRQVLVFAFTRHSPFDAESIACWQSIKESICLTQTSPGEAV
jgi:hypothetical protein